MRYLLTHSLLSSWLYLMKDNTFSDATNEKDWQEDFMKVLKREPTETTEAMQKGIDFEDMVTRITLKQQTEADEQSTWYESAKKVAQDVSGGALQYKASKPVTVDGVDLLLYGRLDCLKAGKVMDIKYSGSYDTGHFFDSTQHPMYLELIPEAYEFVYVVSNGQYVWHETYKREETLSIIPIISDFLCWLRVMNLFDVYAEHWGTK